MLNTGKVWERMTEGRCTTEHITSIKTVKRAGRENNTQVKSVYTMYGNTAYAGGLGATL